MANKQRKSPKQARAIATVQAILDAAAHILRQHGVEGLNTNKVAEVAGVSIGSLYQYFPNKGSLIAALIEQHVEEELNTIGHVIQRHTRRSPTLTRALFEDVIRTFIDIHLTDLPYTRLLHQQVTFVECQHSLRNATHQLELLLIGMIHAAHPNHWCEDTVRRKAFLVVNTIDSLVQRSLMDERPFQAREAFVEDLTDIACHCLHIR